MKPPNQKMPQGDPDPLFRVEWERPLASGGKLRVISSIPQKTVLIVIAVASGLMLGPTLLRNFGSILSIARTLWPL